MDCLKGLIYKYRHISFEVLAPLFCQLIFPEGPFTPSRCLAILGGATNLERPVRVMATGTLGHPWPAVPSRHPWLQGHSTIHGQR